MNFSYNYFQQINSPELRLCNPDGKEIAVINARERNVALRLNNISELTFVVPDNLSDVNGDVYRPSYYDQIETKRLIYVTDIGWFVITGVVETSNGKETYKNVTCESHEASLKTRGFITEERVYCVYNPVDPCDSNYQSSNIGAMPSVVGQLYQQLGIAVDVSTTDSEPLEDYTTWTIDYVNPAFVYNGGSADNLCRSFQASTTNGYGFIANDVQEAFNIVVIFDYLHHAIKIKSVDEITKQTDVYLSFDNVIQNIQISESSEEIRTVLTCKGTDIDIREVNPTGTGYIVDFSNYMGHTLYHSCQSTDNGALLVISNSQTPLDGQIRVSDTGITILPGSYVNAVIDASYDYKWMSGGLSALLTNWKADVDKNKKDYGESLALLRSANQTKNEQDIILQEYNLRLDDLNAAMAQYIQYASPSVAPQFSTSATYRVGDYVKYRGDYYKCIIAITTGGAWVASKWESIGIGDTTRLLVETINVGNTSVREDTIFATTQLSASHTARCYENTPSVSYTASGEVASRYVWDTTHATSGEVTLTNAYLNSTPKLYFPDRTDANNSCYYKIIGAVNKDADGDIIFTRCLSADSGALCVIEDSQTPTNAQICKSTTKINDITTGEWVCPTYGVGSVEVYATYGDIASWIATYEAKRSALLSAMEITENTIDELKEELANISNQIELIHYVSNNNPSLINELMSYWSEGEYINDNIAVFDNTTSAEKIDLAKQLLKSGEEQLSKICSPKYSFTLDVFDFLKIYELRNMMSELQLGGVVTTENTRGGFYYPAVTKIDFSLDDSNSFQLTFSNALRLDDWGYTYADLITESAITSQNVISNWKQLTSYARERDTIQSVISNPLDRTLQLGLSNMYNQEFAIDATGIIGRQYSNESSGYFKPEQLRIINNQILFTDDGWQTVKSAMGKIVYENQTYYGLIGEAIIGSLLVGDTLNIKNSGNTVIINGTGIQIKHGNSTVFSADTNGNASFSGAVNATSLTLGSSATIPASDVEGLSTVATSGDYGDLNNQPDIPSTDNCIKIATSYSGTESGVSREFQVSTKGLLRASNAIISGSITATSLTLADSISISSSKVSGLSTVATSGSYNDLSNKPTIPNVSGFISKDGTIGSTPAEGATGFKVSSSGLLQASNAIIYGTLYSSAGQVGGWTISDNKMRGTGAGMASTSSGSWAFWAGNQTGTGTTASPYGNGAPFRVSHTGSLYATDAHIVSGYIGSDSQGFIISGNSLNKNKSSYSTDTDGVYIGTDGLSIGKENWTYSFSDMSDDGITEYKKSYARIASTGLIDIGSQAYVYDEADEAEFIYSSRVNVETGKITLSSLLSSTYGDGGTSESTASIILNGSGRLNGSWWSESSIHIASDRNCKNSIEPLSESYSHLFDLLSPVRFKYNNGTSGRYHTGFIAQDIESATLESSLSSTDVAMFSKTKPGGQYAVRYDEIIALCVNEIQKLKQRVAELEQINNQATV